MASKQPAAIPNSSHGVPRWNASNARALVHNLDWNDLHALLLVTDHQSFRAAAESSRLSLNTLRRKIERLELRVEAKLLRRSRSGVVPTDIGLMLARAAREMAGAASVVEGNGAANVLISPGEITIGCTEGLGSLWLTPRLNDLIPHLPNLSVSLQLDYDVSRDRSDTVDVGIAFDAPQRPDLVRSRLATVHYALFASEAYIRRKGLPESLNDFRDHQFIEQSGPGLNPGLMKYLVGTDWPEDFIPMRSNSALSVYWAVVNGAGIAALPTYLRSISKHIIPLDISLPMRFELWYYCHADARHSPAVRATIDWLKAAFDPLVYPWFSEELIEPQELKRDRMGNVIPLFEGLLEPRK